MIIRICPTAPRRGNEHIAQGNALWENGGITNALKGQKHFFELLPLQGEYTNCFVHRVLPYAMCFWAFSPCDVIVDNHFFIFHFSFFIYFHDFLWLLYKYGGAVRL